MRSAASDWTSLRVLPAVNLDISQTTCSGLFPLPFGERVRVRGNRSQCVENAFQNTIHVPKHVVVPKSQYQITFRLKRSSPFSILVFAHGVLAAIQLDYQSRGLTAEVRDVAADCDLPAKLQAI